MTVKQRWAVAASLAVGTVLLYAQVFGHPFIYFDDNCYVTENAMVQRGLSWPGLGWAFTTLHVSNWHPLTWLSHMLDVQLFGLNPGAHHLVSAVFHAANAVLLFLVLTRLTRAAGRSSSGVACGCSARGGGSRPGPTKARRRSATGWRPRPPARSSAAS